MKILAAGTSPVPTAGGKSVARRVRTQRAPAGNLFARAARDEYLEEHAERMRRIRRLALAALEREEREGEAGGAGGE